MTTNIANNLKTCYLIIIVPQCMYLRYKFSSPFSSQGRKRRKKANARLRRRRKRGKIWSCILEVHHIPFEALTW